MKYYAIPDLHGRYDLLREAVNEIEKYSANSADTQIVTLGDYIDRGPESRQIIEYLMARGSNWTCLKGNHEDIAVQTMLKPLNPEWWFSNGGDATVKSYNGMEGVIIDHIRWMESLPLFYETEKQVFVHAGIPQDHMNLPPKTDRMKEELLWMLYDSRTAGGWKGKHVVHGHHQSEYHPKTWYGPNGGRTALDTWAYHTGRLVIGVFDDTQGPAKEYIEIKL